MGIRSAVTVSLVPEARGGPFVFWDDLPAACARAAALGFDAVEVFPPAPESLANLGLAKLLTDHGLGLAAVGTGAGWLARRLTLTSADPAVRARAIEFVSAMAEAAAAHGAPVIIGSMQGRWGEGIDRATALGYLCDALETSGDRSRSLGVPLLYEPLNRYETNLVNTIEAGAALLDRLSTRNVKLLADLFHMNIEESDVASAIRHGAPAIGHVHFVDSNRRPVGFGHTDFGPIARALRESGYSGHVSAEALPFPDPDAAARRTIDAFRFLLDPTPRPA